jgi:hypothetical protein
VRAVVAALLVATACTSGGPRPAPSRSPATPSASRPPPSPLALAFRDLAEQTIAGCPCRVSLRAGAVGRDKVQRDVAVDGTWDPATESGEYTVRGEWDDPVPAPGFHSSAPLTVRIVGTAVYVSPADAYGLARSRWARLDFSRPRKTFDTVFAILAYADPTLSFAVLRRAAGATTYLARYQGWSYVEDVLAAAGPAAGRAGLVMPAGDPYFEVHTADFQTFGTLSWNLVTLDEVHVHARRVRVVAPPGAVTVDAFSAKSLTAKRFGTV